MMPQRNLMWEILDSPADADEFHDAIDQMDRQIDQMDRQIDQLEQPPESPFSYAPTTPAETVIADNDEPNTNNNDANTRSTAIPQNEMPADEDLPPVPICSKRWFWSWRWSTRGS